MGRAAAGRGSMRKSAGSSRGEVRPSRRASGTCSADAYSWIIQNSFPSGSENIMYVPQSSFFVGEVIFTPFDRSAFSSLFTSLLISEKPVFPGSSGQNSSHRWKTTGDPFGATVTQCPILSRTSNPRFSWYHFTAFLLSLTTTATDPNRTMPQQLRGRPQGSRRHGTNAHPHPSLPGSVAASRSLRLADRVARQLRRR